MIKLKSMVVEGFGSIQTSTKFQLDREGLYLIKGRNGNGKTTLFSAMSWCLYQTNLKGVPNASVATWQHLRLPEYRGTRVVITIEAGTGEYVIARHLDFKGKTYGVSGASKLLVYYRETAEQDLQLYEGQHKNDQQAFVTQLLGMDAQTFLNSVMFGQRMKRLIEAENEEKRAVFDKLFNVSFVDDAKEKAKSYVEAKRLEQTQTDGKISTITAKIESVETQIQQGASVLENFEETKKERLAELNSRLLDQQTKVKEQQSIVKKSEAALKKLDISEADKASEVAETERKNADAWKRRIADKESERFQLHKKSEQAGIEAKRLEGVVAEYQRAVEEIDTTCTVCGQPLKKEQVADARLKAQALVNEWQGKFVVQASNKAEFDAKMDLLDKDIAEDKKQLVSKEKAYTDAKEKADSFKELLSKSRELGQTVQQATQQIKFLEGSIKTLQADIQKETTSTPPQLNLDGLRADITAMQLDSNALIEAKESISKSIELADWWNKKGFGSGGLKAYVFNAMLTQLNVLVEKYASRLGVSVVFSVDLTKANKPFLTTCYKAGQVIDYKDLSGGEKQRIDVAMAFAMHDLVSKTSDLNILVMDECMEGLDEQGVDVVFELLRMKCGSSKSIYIITHNQMLDVLNAKSITIDKDDNGITSLN